MTIISASFMPKPLSAKRFYQTIGEYGIAFATLDFMALA
jgi:hypothetical protein